MKLYVQLSLLWIASFQLYEAVFVSELCRNRQFGFKVQDPLDCHGFYVCLGDIGQFSLDCGREYRFNETTQRCTLGKCPPCPCAVTDGIPQITGFLPMIIYPLQNNPIIYGFGTNVAPCNSAAQSTSLQNSSSDLPMTLQKGSDKVDSVRAKSDLLSNKTRILMKKLTSKKKAPDTSFICMNKTDGSFERDPNNCSLYYICYDNNAYTQECPGILQFDPSDNMCNMPEIVKCIPVETKDTTTKEIHTNTSTNPIAQTVSYSTNGFTTTSPIETVMTSLDSVSKTTTLWPTTPGADNTTLNPRHETTTLTILETTYTRPLRSRSIDYGSTESSTTRTTIQDSTNYLTTDRTEYTTETFPRPFVPTTNPVETSTISSATTESETNTGTTVESPLTTVETTTPTEETTQSYLPTFTTVATVTITQLSSATFFEGSTTTWTETYTSTVTSDTKVTTTIIPTDVSTITEATAPSDLPTEILSTLTSAEISKEISTTPPTTETYFSTKGSELATDSTVTIVETTEITFTVDTTTSSATEINSTTIATLTPENTTSLSIQSTTTVADLTPITTYISTDSPPPLLTNTITTESPSKTELPTELTKTPDHTHPTTYILTNSPTPLPTNTKTPERPTETKLPTELTTATPATTHIHSEGPNQTKPQTELTTATTSTAVPICLNQPNGKFVRDPNDCNKFYTCFQNLSYLQICPAGLYFDTVLNVCNYRHMVNCPVTTPSTSTPNPTPTHSPKPEDCYRLPGGTFVRDPSDCNVYYVCLNGRAIKLQCPRGQYFDNERFVCNFKYFVSNCKV